jgi:hypothetical protein
MQRFGPPQGVGSADGTAAGSGATGVDDDFMLPSSSRTGPIAGALHLRALRVSSMVTTDGRNAVAAVLN